MSQGPVKQESGEQGPLAGLLGPDPAHRTPLRRLDAALGGPVWWAMALGGKYWMVPRTCEVGSNWPIWAWTLLMFALCVRAGLSSAQILNAARADTSGTVAADRDRYLGWLGLLLSTFFGAVILFEGIPSLFLSGCW